MKLSEEDRDIMSFILFMIVCAFAVISLLVLGQDYPLLAIADILFITLWILSMKNL